MGITVKGKDVNDKRRQSILDGGNFFSLVKGKQWELCSGRFLYRCAHSQPEICDEWMGVLQSTITCMYEKSLIFADDSFDVSLVDGQTKSMPMKETLVASKVVANMCRDYNLNNEAEWE